MISIYLESLKNTRSNRYKAKNLKEYKWKYRLKSGPSLVDALEKEEYDIVIKCLKKCWGEIHSVFPEYLGDDDLQELEADIDSILEESDEGEKEELLHYARAELYDFCENYGIAVNMYRG